MESNRPSDMSAAKQNQLDELLNELSSLGLDEDIEVVHSIPDIDMKIRFASLVKENDRLKKKKMENEDAG